MFPDFILFNSTPCVCFIRANGQWCFMTPGQKSLVKNGRRWQGIYFPTVLSLFSTYFLLGLHLIRNQRGHTFAITTVSLKFSALCHHPPFAHTNPKTDCPQANRKYVFCMGGRQEYMHRWHTPGQEETGGPTENGWNGKYCSNFVESSHSSSDFNFSWIDSHCPLHSSCFLN